jgi:polyisoprenoid-binding protein YceI
MKKFAAIFISCLTAILIETPAKAADNYKFDADHTYAIWHVNHFGFSTVSGKFMAEGTLVVDQAKPENSSANLIIHTANMDTGVPKLDDILKGKNFFAISEFPTATFKSTKVVVTGKDSGKIYGTLTLRGISKDVVLNMKLNKQGNHPYYNKPALGFSGTTTLNRSDFDMRGYMPGVSDETTIELQAEAISSAATQAN